MNTDAIVNRLKTMRSDDLETLFDAVSNASLPAHDYTLGEARQLENFKSVINKNR